MMSVDLWALFYAVLGAAAGALICYLAVAP